MASDRIEFLREEEVLKQAIRSKIEPTSTILVWLLHHIATIPHALYQQSVLSLLRKIHSIHCSILNCLAIFAILNLGPNSRPLRINVLVAC